MYEELQRLVDFLDQKAAPEHPLDDKQKCGIAAVQLRLIMKRHRIGYPGLIVKTQMLASNNN